MRTLAVVTAAVVLTLLAFAPVARAQGAAIDGAAADASVEPRDATTSASAGDDVASAPAKREEGRPLGDTGRLGVALLGVGATVAAATGATTALIEALSRNDSDPDAPPKNPELVEVSGFVVVSALSLSAGVMLLGGALLADDLANN